MTAQRRSAVRAFFGVATVLSLLALTACNVPDETNETDPPRIAIKEVKLPRRPAERRLRLRKLFPASTRAGLRVNPQPTGNSALAVACSDASPATVIVFDGQALSTQFGSSTLLTAILPDKFIAQPAHHRVFLREKNLQSNALDFIVN